MDRLDIVLQDFSAGGAGSVSVRFRSRWSVVAAVAALVGVVTFVWWQLADDRSNLAPWVLVVIVLTNLVRFASRKVLLTDPVLADAAARAAVALGTETKPGRWQIKGRDARSLGPELVRLHNWRTLTTSGSGYLQREQTLIAAAKPCLQPYLRPEVEPVRPEVRSYEPGQPWPVLPAEHPTWPILPPDGQ